MTDIEEFKKLFTEAEKEANEPASEYHESARIIVNIERQSFYGGEPSRNRLEKIRRHFAEVVNKDADSEA